jgi:hypothetical protein
MPPTREDDKSSSLVVVVVVVSAMNFVLSRKKRSQIPTDPAGYN